MRIGGGGSTDINLLQSDIAQFRNEDFVVSQDGAFLGSSLLQAAVSRFPVIQLFNPLATTATIMVDGISFSTTTTQQIIVGLHDTELTSDRGAWISKLPGGVGQGHIRDENFNATTIVEFERYFVLANTPNFIEFRYPIFLQEEEGLAIQGLTITTLMAAGFHGREV